MSTYDLQPGPVETRAVPFAQQASSPLRQRLAKMAVGDSIAVPLKHRVDACDAKAAAHSYAKSVGWKFRTGRSVSGGLYLIERVR
jgi:hypothetical protein